MTKVKYLLSIALLALFAFSYQPGRITIYLAGDSTMSVKAKKAYPETGWGMPFAKYWDSTVTVDNRAQNGRSTKTFISENLWQPIAAKLQPGDYVLIQFGHNDEVNTKASYATESEFKANLIRFIAETRNKQALPVLITPAARRKFDAAGKITETHAVYAQIIRDVAKDNNVPLIDLDRKSQDLLQQLGTENSKLLFNYLEPGEHPNYPDGKQDDTHFSELGATKMAQIVISGIKELDLDLVQRLAKPKLKK
jgi:lysophospholipase L1-like esterase